MRLYDEFAHHVARLLTRSPAYQTTGSTIHTIINPKSGLFSHKDRLRRSVEALEARAALISTPETETKRPFQLHLSEYPGHATNLVEHIVSDSGRRTMLISAGGDGTHKDVLSGLVAASLDRPEMCSVFRLPAGTGNDGADCATLSEAFELLPRLSDTTQHGALEIRTADGQRYYAFNIASFGLDAYVAHITNRLRNGLLGNMYTLVADLATLFYVPVYGIPRTTLHVTRPDGSTHRSQQQYALVAFGVSGHRRYGGDKPILPQHENLVAIELPGFFGRIKLKRHVYRGTHVHDPEVHLDSMAAMVIECEDRLPFQFDGESMWLEPAAFPVTVRRIDSAWHGLRP
ncbi:MAG: diacylglycerol/lipid kinase family protein [Spirochaetaceae bacterium]